MNETFRALVLSEADGKVEAAIETLPTDRLPDGDVTVAVEYSTLNYKDGLIVNGLGRLVRSYPHVPGVDFAGTVTAAADRRFAPGDKVVLTGWRVGERHWGGYAQQARVKGDWLVKLPTGLTTEQAMAIGTAGLAAMLAVEALEAHGLAAGAGDVLVTGAAGGVGSMAVALLAQAGHRVVASTGRVALADYLKGLGAADVIDRAALAEGPARPLDTERWGGCVDAVGGATLAAVLSQLRYSASVAACGLAGGSELATTVIPFLLRGVNLLGIDTVMQPRPARERAWARLARDMPAERLAAMTTVVPLAEVPALARAILDGKLRGRTVVDVNR